MKNLSYKRSSTSIKFITETWDNLGIPYIIKHGTYTTILESELGTHKLMVNKYRPRVFAAKNKVKRDVMNSEVGREIMNRVHQKKNFGIHPKSDVMNINEVLNIDLSAAYVWALWNSGCITDETFQYINTLSKKERLPSLGMLAASHVKFYFEKGKCVNYETHREPTSEIFFYLIQVVNDVMEECRFLLGNDYIFHWVDGVFFKKETSVKKVNRIEKYLEELGFPYKYEMVENFKLGKNDEKYVISMVKNGENKTYEFSDNKEYEDIKNFLAKRRHNYQDE